MGNIKPGTHLKTEAKSILLITPAAPDQTPFSTTEKRPPLGVGYLISVLRRAGHKVFFIDNYLQPNNFLDTNILQENSIDFVGLYANTICLRDTLRILHKLQFLRYSGKWNGKIIVGGPHTSVAVETIPDFVDFIVQGEGEDAIIDIVEDRVRERIVRYPRIVNLDKLPLPAWDYFVKLPYHWGVQWFPEKPVFTMNTSRGCPFGCSFCSVSSVWGRKYSFFSAERVVTEIEFLMRKYDAKGFYFREDNFTANRKRLLRFCNLLLERGINIPWACETRVDSLDREVVELMHRAGARAFYFGVESGSQRILNFLNKGITVDQISNAFRYCREFGIKTAANIMIGVPTETAQDIHETQKLLEDIRPSVIWHNVFVGIPHSPLYRYVIDNRLYAMMDDRGLVYLKGHDERVRAAYRDGWNAYMPFKTGQDDKIADPEVSVIMAVHNGERYLEKAVKSILSQSFQNFELIIIDDASTDRTAELLAAYNDPRIITHKNGKRRGPAGSRNRAVQLARGRYLAIMDADDFSLPHRLAMQVEFLKNKTDIALVGSSFYEIGEDDQIRSFVSVLTDHQALYPGLLNQNWFGHSTVMIRKDAMAELNGYDERFKYAHDYELFIRMSERYKLANIAEPLCCWRSSPESISNKKKNEQQYYARLAVSEAKKRRQEKTGPSVSEPLVSVIVPTYNRPDMLDETLKSVLRQTFKDFEIIVINDGGADVEDRLKTLNTAGNIHYVRHERNRGLPAARNTGIRLARGKYIAYLDDDDVYYPDHLETLVSHLESNEHKVAYTDAHRAFQEKRNGRYQIVKKDVPYSFDFDYERILRDNFIPVLCVMHEKSCLGEVGLFDETLKSLEDWDLWMRMSRKFKFAHIPKVTCAFTWRQDGSTMTTGQSGEMAQARTIVTKRGRQFAHEGLFPPEGKRRPEETGEKYANARKPSCPQKEDEAIDTLGRHLEFSPEDALAHNDLGVLCYKKGQKDKALEYYEKAAALDPRNTTILKNLADFYYIESGRIDKAFEIYQRILTDHPDDVETLISLGHIVIAMGRLDVAEKLFNRVLEIEPQNITVRDSLEALRNLLQVRNAASHPGEDDKKTCTEIPETKPGKHEGQIKASIVIPVFNHVDYTRKCIESVKQHTTDICYELIFVDNASTDETPVYLRSLQGNTKIVTNESNVGFTKACNQGARMAAGEYVVFLNNDTEPQDHWLESLIDLARSDERIGIVGSKLVYPDGRLQEAGGIIFSDGQGWNYGRLDDPDKPDYSYVREVDYVSGASLLVRKDLLEKLNYFDESYSPGYYEDTDLCFGARSLGYRVMFCPFSRVIHHEGISSGTDLSQGMKRYQVINREKFIKKWSEELKKQYASRAENIIAASERNTRGNILVIDPSLPMFDRASGSLRLFHIVRLLNNQGYHITFIARNGSGQERYARILQGIGVEVFATDPAMLRSMGLGAQGMGIDLEKLLARRFYEAAYLSFYEIALQYLPAIRECSPETKIIIDSVDIHFVREQRMAEIHGDQDLMVKAEKTKDEEIAIYGEADAVVTITEEDWGHLKSHLPGKEHFVIPNIHPTNEDAAECEEREGLLFVGNFNHPPNADAVKYFVRDVLPIVKRELPGMTLTIVGNNPSKEIISLRNNDIIVTGYVPATEPYLKKARVSISPLRFGSGMKGKIGEAMAAGLPVVTTSIGAEGMNLVSGHTAFIADDAESFAREIVKLCSDDRLWTAVASAGKQYIRDNFSPERVDERLREMMSRVVVLKRQAVDICDQKKNKEKDFVEGLVSIVILTFNELDYTKRCVESIRKRTPESHEIIFVDNGSKDGTVKWFKTFVTKNTNFRLIANKENLGFARGCNQGIEASKGEYILLLNNDILVTENWLPGMLEHLNSSPDIGIVGPMTNNISGIQKVEGVTYRSVDDLQVYAREFRNRNRHRRVPSRRLVGFCMLFRRSLVNAIGPLDETFGTGNFEDDDFCLRATLAGYRNVIAGDVFIHHYGSRSFIGNKINYGATLTGHRKIFDDKWRGLQLAEGLGRSCLALKKAEVAREYHQSGQLNKAVDLYLEAIKFVPSEPKTYHELAEILIQTKNFKDALDVLNEMPLEGRNGKTQILTGFAREGLNEDDAAGILAEKTLEQSEVRAEALNLKGILAYKKEALEEAASLFRQAIEVDPSYGEAHANLGVVKWKKEPGEEAFRFLEKGFILSPDLADVANLYHAAAKNMGQLEQATAIFREAKCLHPLNRSISFLLIDLLMSLEKFGEAMEEIERAMALFEIDEGFMKAALEIRSKTGPLETPTRKKDRNKISLCMIVKNEERNLVRCLSTTKPAVDEIIVVDTGSTDRTKDIAAAFGAKVFDIPWRDDFSEARNLSLAKAAGDWILVLDADEVIAPCDFGGLRKLTSTVKGRKAGADGFILTTRNYTAAMTTEGWIPNDGSYAKEEAGPGWYPSRKVRLFRNDPRIRFKNSVHELVEDSMLRHKLKILTSSIPVHHYGTMKSTEGVDKGEIYYRLGKKKIDESGGNARAIYELAVVAARLRRYDEAVDLWNQFLDSGSKEDLHLAYMNLGHVCLETGLFKEAAINCKKALEIDPELKEAHLNLAMSEVYMGRPEEAVAILDNLIQKIPDYIPAQALSAAALILIGRTDRYKSTVEYMRKKNTNPAVFFQAYVKKLLSAGRDEDGAKLLAAARSIWSDLLKSRLKSRSLEASDEEIERIMMLAGEEGPLPGPVPVGIEVDPEFQKGETALGVPALQPE
ncbi:MAG TPA: glycosyltransferase [Syntrophales bacterium]|nr:glycosyltransferase [Syntrophales bacterium]HQM29760.1 glycosyltransferase [Syntrophales bacterium]